MQSVEAQSCYLIVTFAPTSDIFSAIFSASSLETASLMGLGASSTTAFASLRPRPVSSRTTLMTLILLGPTSERMASNSVCSSTGAAASAASAAAGAGPAAAATGAALTPHFSCRVLVNSTSSSTFNFSMSAMMVSTDMVSLLKLLGSFAFKLFGASLDYVTKVAHWRGKQTIGSSQRSLNDADGLGLGVVLPAKHFGEIFDLVSGQCAATKNARFEHCYLGGAYIIGNGPGCSNFVFVAECNRGLTLKDALVQIIHLIALCSDA